MQDDCQGIGLITGTDDTLYMAALCTIESGATFNDVAMLFKIILESGANETKVSAELLSKRHVYSDGGAPGQLGVHFRYGAGIRFDSEGRLVLLSTERDFILRNLTTNYWV
jgi:hypothetical protein